MSWRSMCLAVDYIEQLRCASPKSFEKLCEQMWSNTMMAMPLYYILEQSKAPLRNLDGADGLFRIPYADMFYLDMLGHELDEVVGIAPH